MPVASPRRREGVQIEPHPAAPQRGWAPPLGIARLAVRLRSGRLRKKAGQLLQLSRVTALPASRRDEAGG